MHIIDVNRPNGAGRAARASVDVPSVGVPAASCRGVAVLVVDEDQADGCRAEYEGGKAEEANQRRNLHKWAGNVDRERWDLVRVGKGIGTRKA
jgi:hypothetical protein